MGRHQERAGAGMPPGAYQHEGVSSSADTHGRPHHVEAGGRPPPPEPRGRPAEPPCHLRAELDFETNLRSEVWSLHIGPALGLGPDEVERDVQELVAHARAEIRNGQAELMDPGVMDPGVP